MEGICDVNVQKILDPIYFKIWEVGVTISDTEFGESVKDQDLMENKNRNNC